MKNMTRFGLKLLILMLIGLLYGCGESVTNPVGTHPIGEGGTLTGRIITDAGTQLSQTTWLKRILALVFTFVPPVEAVINTGNTVGVPNLSVQLLDEEHNVIGSTSTNLNGDFTFAGIPFSDYIVKVAGGSNTIDFEFGVSITPNRSDRSILCKIEKVGGEINVVAEINGLPVAIHNNLTGSSFTLPIPVPGVSTPTPIPVSTPSPTPSGQSTPTPTPIDLTPTPTPRGPTPTPSATAIPDLTSTPTPTPSTTPMPSPTPTPEGTTTPTPTPTITPTPDLTATPTATPSATPTPEGTETSTPTPSPTPTPEGTETPTPTPTVTPTPEATHPPTPSLTPSPTPFVDIPKRG